MCNLDQFCKTLITFVFVWLLLLYTVTQPYHICSLLVASIKFLHSFILLTVSCSCDINVTNDDKVITVCAGPSDAPCLCDSSSCVVSYN